MFNWIIKFFNKKTVANKRVVETWSESDLVYTNVQELVVGMFIAKLDRPWLESPFKFQGFNIKSNHELQTVKSVCNFVYIDESKQRRSRITAANERIDRPLIIGKPPKKLGSFEKEIRRATRNYHATGKLIATFMHKVANGGGIDTKQAKDAVASSVNSILHSPDAHLWLSQLKNKDEYTAQHSLNVCMLSIVLGRHIGLGEQELKKVGLCGMMHDMGKMLIPSEILNKPGELDPEELAIMQTHTTLGAELLKSSPNMFSGAVETALTHHERINGQGYPRALKRSGVSYYSNIVSIVDTYDALTSDRPYRKGKTHLEATQVLYQQAGTLFDNQLVTKFIESLGVFPPGCYVKLSDDRIALVIEANVESKLRPQVMTIMDTCMNPIKEMIVNLDNVLTDATGEPLFIQNIISPEKFKINRTKHFKEGVIRNGFAMAGS